MRKKIFAVCDLEVAYAVRLMEYLSQKRNIPFELQAFTSVESLTEFCKKTPIELLLISDKAMCREVREQKIGQIVILSEGAKPSELDLFPSVYKYQSSDNVLREVMAYYGAENEKSAEDYTVWKKKTEILAVYSPLHRSMKTSAALTLGQLLARKKPALYLNLEEYSGFEALFDRKFEADLGDLLYYSKQESSNLVYRMNAMVVTVNNLDIVPPARMPWDVRGASSRDWKRLLGEIAKSSAYEAMILDVGTEMEDLYELLELCDHIYMPVLSDRISQCKMAQFREMLAAWNKESLLEKTTELNLPFHASSAVGPNFVEQLLWSELADYLREVLRKEGAYAAGSF